MTTIVYRDGIMAADRRGYSGESTPIGAKRKIHRLDDGSLVGVSTTTPGLAEAVVNWFQSGFDEDLMPNVETKLLSVLYVNPDGEVYFAGDNLLLTGPLEAEFFAIGSGDNYALGAMAMGACAAQAVEIATQFDVWTGNGVQMLALMPKAEVAA